MKNDNIADAMTNLSYDKDAFSDFLEIVPNKIIPAFKEFIEGLHKGFEPIINFMNDLYKCPSCNGDRILFGIPCHRCGGTGIYFGEED